MDGFRVDAIHHLIEAEHLRDNPLNPDWREGQSPARRLARLYSLDQEETHDVIAEMRALVDTYEDRVLIGEASLPIEQLMAYYGDETPGFHLPFNFHLIKTPWEPHVIAALIEQYEGALAGGMDRWPNWVLGNHDRSRVASRIGIGAGARRRDAVADLARHADHLSGRRDRHGRMFRSRRRRCAIRGRRTCRGLDSAAIPSARRCNGTMSENAGFTGGEPWLPLASDYALVNVQRSTPIRARCCRSIAQLIALRRREPALSIGVHVKAEAVGDVLTYRRFHAGRWISVALNFSDQAAIFRERRRRLRRPDLDPSRSDSTRK